MDRRKSPEKFVPSSYHRSDSWAIEAVKTHLMAQGYSIYEKHKEDFGPDILASLDGTIELFECETKTGYSFTGMEDFRFDTVSFLGRKKKWADLGFWYLIVCRETGAYVQCHSSEIFQPQYLSTLQLDSQERKGDDSFYRVPKTKCTWGKLLQ